jgi:hypothetical protein
MPERLPPWRRCADGENAGAMTAAVDRRYAVAPRGWGGGPPIAPSPRGFRRAPFLALLTRLWFPFHPFS